MTKYDQVAVDDEDEMQELIMASQNTKKPRMTMYIAIFAVVAVIGVVVVIMMGGSDSSTSDVTASEAKNSDYVESSVYKVSIDLSDVEATEEITVVAEVELEGDFDSITDMDEFESAATESLATTFDVDESQIEITDVHEGSIVIDFIVHDVESEDVSSMIQDEIVTIEAIEVDGTDYGVLESAAVEEVITVEDAIAQSLAESLGIEAEDIDMACDSTSCTYEITEEDLEHLDSVDHGDVVAGAIGEIDIEGIDESAIEVVEDVQIITITSDDTDGAGVGDNNVGTDAGDVDATTDDFKFTPDTSSSTSTSTTEAEVVVPEPADATTTDDFTLDSDDDFDVEFLSTTSTSSSVPAKSEEGESEEGETEEGMY